MPSQKTIIEWQPVCQVCAHYNLGCPAFPNGIPRDIWQGEDEHRTVRDGQVGDFVLTFASPQDEKNAHLLGLIR